MSFESNPSLSCLCSQPIQVEFNSLFSPVSVNINVIVIQSSKGRSMEDIAEFPSQVVTELAPPSSFVFTS